MSDQDIITPSRQVIRVGDARYKSALSEAVMSKFGSAINFINDRIVNVYPIHFGGYFRVQSINNHAEPMIYIHKDTEFAWYTLSIGKTGSAGDNRCNFKVIDSTGAILGDLFSTPPVINQTSLDNPVVGRDFSDNSTIQQVTTSGFDFGTINPAYETLLEGWKLRPYIVGNATNSLGMTMTLALKIKE